MVCSLMILEVSKKQDYIFGSKKLKENAERSADIHYVTSNEFFEKVAGNLYRKEKNYVYSGGGHTILQFHDDDVPKAFAQKVTEYVLRNYIGLEIFVKIEECNTENSPGSALKELSSALERKKARRKHTVRRVGYNLGNLMTQEQEKSIERLRKEYTKRIPVPDKMDYPSLFEELNDSFKDSNGQADNFIAVVHIDGNAMGTRVDSIYKNNQNDWESTCESLRGFSESIQADFENAFMETVQVIINQGIAGEVLPIRPVILAGDDVCFVTAGCIGLECARIFLEKLAKKENKEDHKKYAACAGVAIVHTKYPFHQAYQLSEELCSNAKKYGASLDENGSISAIDWHIEFGQLKDNLAEIRKDYETDDGNRLELRPYIVVSPDRQRETIRDYQYFRTLCMRLKDNKDQIARSKVKEWRTALKQGKVEGMYFLHDKKMKDILYHIFDSMYRTEQEKSEQFLHIMKHKESSLLQSFAVIDKTEMGSSTQEKEHCLFFDAIEMMDHCKFIEEE